jgi:uncharacterized protein YjbI with pentapeptide repeats
MSASNPFAGESFTDTTFTEVTLEPGDLDTLVGKEFQRCIFRRCKLAGSRWRETKLEDCRFESCDLTRILPAGMALRGVVFAGCKLMGVDFTDVGRLPDFAFEDCDLRYASFVKLRLRALKLTGCVAREANFLEVDLSEADFSGTDLGGSTITGCTLGKTNFTRATDVFFDPLRNKVKGARIATETAVLMAQAHGLVVVP